MDEPKGSHRTRSKAAPDWTVEESLVLINEINAVESEWGVTLPSFQKWQQIVENCNALDVNRNLNQCRRKWDVLLSEYRRAKHEAAAGGSFPVELFRAIDRCVKGKRNGGGGVEEEEAEEEEEEKEDAAAVKEEQTVMETDPDSDPEAQERVTKFSFEPGSKKQRRRMKRQKRRTWGYYTSTKIKHEESSSINEKMENTMNIVESSIPEDSKLQTQERVMATMLWENALQINALLGGNLADDVDYKLADLKNAEAVQTDFTRRQADKLIDCLGKISATLNQLCDLVQQCN